MNRKIECRSDGCGNEVLFKPTLEGGFNIHQPNLDHYHYRDHRRSVAGGRRLSPYCKQHTCAHFHREECCTNKKPPHDTVCAVHTRCPIPDCHQARAQFLDPNFDPLSNAVPRYARYERRASTSTTFCQAREADGCGNERQDQLECCEKRAATWLWKATIPSVLTVDMTCEMNGCGGAKHFEPNKKEYLPYCTNRMSLLIHEFWCPV
uniref:Uncharacterized protein n=1 Tax=Podospora anserina (strain S / ATCC MYA-4624 / DSM 980 / FGSC 10383) TaxID=515849 RepID=A0A090CP16_PODAN|nr:Putative protein of unknown function [Podospora anserina S mat+]